MNPKYRIWDNLKKEWVCNKHIWRMKTNEQGTAEMFPPAIYWSQHPEGLTYLQFTGMTDRKGKEVYSGDIVQSKDNVGIVYFAAGTFMIDGDGPLYEHVHSVSPDILEDYIVIGNKFDNPELLKQ